MSNASGKTEGAVYVAQTEYISSFIVTVMKYLRPESHEVKSFVFVFVRLFLPVFGAWKFSQLSSGSGKYPSKISPQRGSTPTTGVCEKERSHSKKEARAGERGQPCNLSLGPASFRWFHYHSASPHWRSGAQIMNAWRGAHSSWNQTIPLRIPQQRLIALGNMPGDVLFPAKSWLGSGHLPPLHLRYHQNHLQRRCGA